MGCKAWSKRGDKAIKEGHVGEFKIVRTSQLNAYFVDTKDIPIEHLNELHKTEDLIILFHKNKFNLTYGIIKREEGNFKEYGYITMLNDGIYYDIWFYENMINSIYKRWFNADESVYVKIHNKTPQVMGIKAT